MPVSVLELKFRILHKLVKLRVRGGKHTENIINGLPVHLIGAKETKEALKELVRGGWLIPAKKTGEIHYSLNSRKVNEIIEFIESYKRKSPNGKDLI